MIALTTTLPGQAGDGTPEFVLTFASAMTDRQVTIVAPRTHHGDRTEVIGGVTIRRMPYFPSRFEALADEAILPSLRSRPRLVVQVIPMLVSLFVGALLEARRHQAEVIHAHWIVPGGVLAMAISRLTGIPYVVTAHGADAYALNGFVGRSLKRLVCRRALAVYPVSDDIGRHLAALTTRVGPVTRMGVDGAVIRGAMGVRDPKPDRLLFVGRLADKKGLDVAIAALARSDAGWTLRVVGDGPEREHLERLAVHLGVERSVEFLGHQDRERVLEEYRTASAVLLPSRRGAGGDQDGTPVVLMEAMALGVPVIASDIGGIGECVEQAVTGVLVTPGDIDELAAALDRAWVDPDQLVANARSALQASIGFDVAAVARQFEDDLGDRLDRASSAARRS